MAWTYAGDPAASNLATVRFLIGDTDTTDQLLNDAEINYLISVAGGNYEAGARAIDQIIASGRLVDKTVGDISISGSARALDLRQVQRSLRYSGSLSALPYAGGISVADMESQRRDSDIPTPAFTKGQFDHPNVNLPGTGRFETSTST